MKWNAHFWLPYILIARARALTVRWTCVRCRIASSENILWLPNRPSYKEKDSFGGSPSGILADFLLLWMYTSTIANPIPGPSRHLHFFFFKAGPQPVLNSYRACLCALIARPLSDSQPSLRHKDRELSNQSWRGDFANTIWAEEESWRLEIQ